MPGVNGRSMNGQNGHPDHKGNGVVSSTLIDDLNSRRHARETYMMLARAVKDGADMPEGTMKAAVGTAIKDMAEAAPSTRARAREFLLSVRKHSVDAAIALDKIERLDSGQNTEQVGVNIQSKLKRLHDPASLAALETLADRTTEFTDE